MSADRPAAQTGTRRGLAGRVLGDRYRVIRMVSAGTYTLIADAEDIELNRPVTVKLIRPELAESAAFRARFSSEMRTMSALSHPNIAAVHDWGEERVGKRTTVFAVVEHLSGGSLRDLFDRGRYLDPSQALIVGLEACRGLDFAHRKGLVHTELTPAKLVFGDDRRLRIVDFGLARMLGAHDWSEPATVATHVARYSSPEQALGQPIDGKTDVYSLALILVEAVTGTVPFAARSTVATLSARIGRLMPVSADLGPLASVLEKAGRPEPADRSTAAELGRSLVRTAEKLPRPKPIPLLITGLFEDDPSRLRRPNDPTGGITRPAPADEPVPLVPPVPAPEAPAADPAADVAPGAATTPEEAAAVAAAAAVATDRAPAAAPVADAPSTSPPPLPPPVVEVVEEASPRLYDGDADRTVDELAALAKATAAPEAVPPEAPAADPSPGDPGWSASLETLDDGRSRRRWPAWLAGILVVLALAGLGFLAYRLFLVPTHEVPELVGLDEEAAEAQTAGFDWELDVETARSDEQPEPGAIIRTAPSAGERLAEGEPFLIVVSEGPEFRRLPDFAGQPLNEAETTLAELRLVALPPTQQFDETVPVGSVVSWSVPAEPSLVAGDEVLPEAEVALVVSSGPAPRAIPALVGISVADATAQLEAMQLVAATGEPVFSDDIPAGNVVSITPAAATEVPRDSTVTLVPSKGVDLVVMPDLTGQTLDQAGATLAGAGLNVGSLLGTTQGLFAAATVAGDPADPGEQFKRGTAVDLVFL